MSETRDALEAEIGARAVGTTSIDGRHVPVAFPADEAQVQALLALAASRRWRVLPIGSGTKLDRGALREKPRFAISVRGLSGVTSFERGDGTITARAGSTMSALSQIARSSGMHLTPDVAAPQHATLGGTLGAGVSGVDRLRYGPVRHHVLGMRVALADGTTTRTGGRLVKNVTGYDLHRLYTGSRGSLCVILEASLRLFPAPEHEFVLDATYFGRDAALQAAASVLASPVRPTCVAVESASDGGHTLIVALAGRREPVEWERDHVSAILGDPLRAEGRDARERIERLRDAELDATLRVGTSTRCLPRVLDAIDARTRADGTRARLVIHPGLATVDVRLTTSDGSTSVDELHVETLARELLALDVEVELRATTPAVRGRVDAVTNLPAPARALSERLRDALDPERRFAGDRPATTVASSPRAPSELPDPSSPA